VDNLDDLHHRLGDVIRAARAALGVSIDAAARGAKVSPVTWRRVERGQGIYGPTKKKVEAYLGLPEGAITDALVSDDAMLKFEQMADAIAERHEHNSTQPVQPADRPERDDVPRSQLLDTEALGRLDLPDLYSLRDSVLGVIMERERAEVEQRMQFVVPQVADAHQKLRELEDRLDAARANGHDRSMVDGLQEKADAARNLAATVEHVLFELPDRYHDQAVREIEQLLGRAYRPVGLGRGLAALIPRRPATSGGT
jgi:hypothetical protein